MFNFFRKVKKEASAYEPLIKIFIYKSNIIHNLRTFQNQYKDLRFAPVLKSNAYGHGISEVSSILDKEGLPFFVVDSLFEAKILSNLSIKTPILVIGYTSAQNIQMKKYRNVAFTITSLEHLRLLDKELGHTADFHLKIDTGMHRQGIMKDEIESALNILRRNKYIKLVGLCTHFADADNIDSTFTESQISLWNEVAAMFRATLPSIKYFHCANSAGVYYANKVFGNVARIGVSLYGVNVSPHEKLDLKPALEMVSVISGIRHINAGEYVGYNITFKSEKPMKIATVPVGYFEGVDRRLSNVGAFLVKGVPCPIVGRISMNITTIDVSLVPNVSINDKVVVISADKNAPNSLENISKTIGTIAYENLVRIPQHLKRVIV
jgi:alanine racemase